MSQPLSLSRVDACARLANPRRLGFLIRGGDNLLTPSDRLSELAPFWSTESTAAKKDARSAVTTDGQVDANAVGGWLASTLGLNELLYPPTPSPAAALLELDTAPLQAPPPAAGAPAITPQRPAQPTPLIVNGASHTTVLHHEPPVKVRPESSASAEALCQRDAQINHCREAYVYLLSPFRHVTVMGCTDCTIVVGAVSRLIHVLGCERVRIVTACRRLCVANCIEAVFCIFSPEHPVLAGDNRACQFAPFCTGYHALPTHLAAAQLPTASPPAINYWNSPLDLSTMGLQPLTGLAGALEGEAASKSSHALPKDAHGPSPGPLSPKAAREKGAPSLILPPMLFHTLVVPLSDKPDGPASVGLDLSLESEHAPQNPFALPPEYAAMLADRVRAVEHVRSAVKDASLSPSQQREVEEALRARFAEWLVSSGNLRQVIDLVQAERAQGM